jgi:hypothetical protein
MFPPAHPARRARPHPRVPGEVIEARLGGEARDRAVEDGQHGRGEGKVLHHGGGDEGFEEVEGAVRVEEAGAVSGRTAM